MRVKVCGLTRRADVELAVELGATHLGFVLAADSPRAVRADAVPALTDGLPADVAPVLVFRGAPAGEVAAAARATGIDRVQLHGFRERDARALEAAGLRVHRVRSLAPGARAPRASELDPAPRVESPWHLDVGAGGSGRRFAWSSLELAGDAPLFVSGGITPDNAAELLRHAPWGIDLSSGVESRPGAKDPAKLRALFRALEVAT